ncbi:MAG: hypothetical protein P0S95_08495 [Rhabdochlamydiaceae bacterium]|nr:hypothetical protein [Candidatus Amphrikana amoebophyrae]
MKNYLLEQYYKLFKAQTPPNNEIFNFTEEAKICASLKNCDSSDILLYQLNQRGKAFSKWLFAHGDMLDKKRLIEAIDRVKPAQFFSYPYDQFQQNQFQQIIYVCQKLLDDEKLLLKFNRFSPPLASQYISEVVRDTLQLEMGSIVGRKEVKMAAFSALITPLRQTVGSCFATAPAILIQSEQIDQMMDDLFDLLTLGRLKRVMNGEEIKSPISLNYGEDILNQPAKNVKPVLELCGLNVKRLYIQTPNTLTIKELLRAILLKNCGLTEEEVKVIQKRSKLSSSHLRVKAKSAAQVESKVNTLLEREKSIQLKLISYFSNPLLKSWEYTIASFTDFEVNAFKWNMVAALGFEHQEEGGVGQIVYLYLEQRLKDCNQELMEMQQEVERANNHLNATHSRMKRETNPDRVRSLKAEAHALMGHLRATEEMMEKLNDDAKHTSQFFIYLLEQFESFFKLYFQEIYEPSLKEVNPSLFADSPAGFRLVYKHGRNEPLVWTAIYEEEGYIAALQDFFISIEPIMINGCEWEKGKDEIELVTRKICDHLQSKDFMLSAYKRIKQKGVSNNTSPWSYISGGTLETLVRCYYSQVNKLIIDDVKPQTPQELAVHWIDLLKELPSTENRLLLETPSHAALLMPHMPLFAQGWKEKGFTYTWLRDEVIEPGKDFYQSVILNRDEQEFLFTQLLEKNSLEISHEISREFSMEKVINLKKWSDKVIKFFIQLHFQATREQLDEMIQGFLASALPIFNEQDIMKIVAKYPSLFGEVEVSGFTTYSSLCNLLKFQMVKHGHFDLCMEERIVTILRDEGFSLPPTLFVADTNWTPFYFTFQTNPVSLEFELWRSSLCRLNCSPMLSWRKHFSQKERGWKIYTSSVQYGVVEKDSSAVVFAA